MSSTVSTDNRPFVPSDLGVVPTSTPAASATSATSASAPTPDAFSGATALSTETLSPSAPWVPLTSLGLDSAAVQELSTAAAPTDATPAPSLDTLRTDPNARITLGMSGDSVKAIQGMINVQETGLFGPTTQAAVKNFQAMYNIKPPAGQEGQVGGTTLKTMETITQGGTVPAPTVDQIKGNSDLRLSFGMQGDSVTQLQKMLHVTQTGIFDEGTRTAVMAFQSNHGLTPPVGQEGSVGKTTFNLIEQNATPVQTGVTVQDLLNGKIVNPGDSGDAVKYIQKAVGLAQTGTFDKATTAAVLAFKQAHGLTTPSTMDPAAVGATTLKELAKAPGADPLPGSSNATVQKILDEAASHIGFHEGPGNDNPFSHYFGRPSEAWCADFVSYCCNKAGITWMNTAAAQGVEDTLRDRGTWKGRNDPQPGDAITFRWDGDGGGVDDHVGMVEKVWKDANGQAWVGTIEGNSSDQVIRHTYKADDYRIHGYGRIA